eukprot:CAMPEP_0118915668 /NCGR_PEP_ID=MMETSP1166-20130328/15799_1 /TAXON_ID=1104430 /ORGANISM="Chrysoreinhardia sp, Strain CCMP3193" /LENGTH=35 /DNA_ID= /DNA_START= /DNA_END= /DNA_ORIENTATION=
MPTLSKWIRRFNNSGKNGHANAWDAKWKKYKADAR